MRILVCGSRTWTDGPRIYDAIVNYTNIKGWHTVIHGNARGADLIAAQAANELNEWANAHLIEFQLEIIAYPANWKLYGKSAGYIRNKQMLEEGKPDLVLAFWDGKSRGTKMMIDLAKKAGIETEIFLP